MSAPEEAKDEVRDVGGSILATRASVPFQKTGKISIVFEVYREIHFFRTEVKPY
mgnify:CR=1 FL=1